MTTPSARPEGRDGPTPIPVAAGTLRFLLAGVAVAAVLVGWVAPTVVTILLGGVTIALFLSYPVAQLARIMPCGLAVLVAFIGLIAPGELVLLLIIPILVEQLTAMSCRVRSGSTSSTSGC